MRWRCLRQEPRQAAWAAVGRAAGTNRSGRALSLSLYARYDRARKGREFRSRIAQLSAYDHFHLPHEPHRNVVLVVVDSLRNSRLSGRGYHRQTTPFLDSLPARFSAISAASWTYPSVASILTGLYPHNHNAVLSGATKDMRNLETFQRLRANVPVLPEMLSLLGYRVHFGSAITMAEYAVRGRAVIDRYGPATEANVILDDLVSWILKKNRQSFFAYLHLADLHIPMKPPDDFRHFFGPVADLPNIDTWAFFTAEQRRADPRGFEEYRQNRELLYDNSLRYVDSVIGELHRKLQHMGLADSTLFIVTADHGEEFWEHAELAAEAFLNERGVCGISHGHAGFQELIEVPLLISGPVSHGEHLHFVSAVDIVPTVLDFLGIGHNLSLDGLNVFDSGKGRSLLSEASSVGHEKKALVADRYKLIQSKDEGIEWLFDLEKDPQEQRPITDPQVTSIFVDKLDRMLMQDQKRKIREIGARKPTPMPPGR